VKIEITDHAFTGLGDIYSYIARNDSIESADYVVDSIEKQINALLGYPLRGAQVKELVTIGNKDYKEVFFKPYRIIYKVKDNTVFVVIVADGQRDFKALLERRLLGV
jgi:toxin ParE1/3/4